MEGWREQRQEERRQEEGMLTPGIVALAEAIRAALELPESLTGQVMLNFNQGRLESTDERIHRRAPKIRDAQALAAERVMADMERQRRAPLDKTGKCAQA